MEIDGGELMRRYSGFIGDQFIYGCLGRKKKGISNILVKPHSPKEEIQIVLKRYLDEDCIVFLCEDA